MRTTTKDLQIQLDAYKESVETLGAARPDRELILDQGGQGNPWRLHWRYIDGGACGEPPFGRSYLGQTKREACSTLYAINLVLWDVIQHHRGQ